MIDYAITATHNEAFPSKLLAANGGGHIFDIQLTANHDNGVIVGRGDYVKLGTYKEAAAPVSFAGKIVEQAANGNWYVEVVTPAEALWILMPEISPYGLTQLENPKCWYNASGDTVKGYSLVKGDVFELSAEGFSTTPTTSSIGKSVSFSTGKYVIAN
jgi:hypothetical protein